MLISENEYITVAVLSFNSSNTILSTLDSIKDQSFKRIDLIINDDCSSDDSIRIIDEWLENNKNAFRKVHFHKNNINMGTSASFDYVLRRFDNEWCKVIAGDDIMEPDCLKKNIDYVISNDVSSIVYSLHHTFIERNSKILIQSPDLYDVAYLEWIGKLPPNKQYQKLLRKDIVFSSTVFINTKKYISLGGIDLRIKYIEDWPLRLLFSSAGEKIHVLEDYTVLYRIGESVSHSNRNIYNVNHLKQKKYLKKLLVYPNIPKYQILYYANEGINDFRIKLILSVFKNKRTKISLTINKAFMIFEIDKWKKLLYLLTHRRNNDASN